MKRLSIALVMMLLTLKASTQVLTELQTFRGSDTPNGSGNAELFGFSMDISGNTAIVSAPNYLSGGVGAVYVFELNGSDQWVEKAKLTPSDGVSYQGFGICLSIENDVIVIGGYEGKVYIYEKPMSGWASATETFQIARSSGTGFGTSLDFNGSELVVGAPYETWGNKNGAGKVYVYEKSGASWSTAIIRAELTSSDFPSGNLGGEVMFADDMIVTTGFINSTFNRHIQIYERPTNGVWANAIFADKQLVGSSLNSNGGDAFGGGFHVSANGEIILAAAFKDYTQGSDMSFYTFERENTSWSTQSTSNEQSLTDLPSYFYYSNSVDPYLTFQTQGTIAFLGNGSSTGPTQGNNSSCGSVFIQDLSTGNPITEIDGLDFSANGLFGSNIAVDGSKVLISSPQETVGGAVRYFDLSISANHSAQLCYGGDISFGSQTITSPGLYQETFLSKDGLDSLVNLTVMDSDLALSATTTGTECFGATTGTATLTGSGGLAPYEYSADGISFSTSNELTGLPGGNSDVYVRDANGCVVSMQVTVAEPAEVMTPTVTNATAAYGARNSSGLVITPHASDAVVSHYQISNISGGILMKNDGTIVINDGDLITVAEGASGLVFEPNGAGTGSFDIQSAGSSHSGCLGGNVTSATITTTKAVLTATADDISISTSDQIPQLTISYSGFVGQDAQSDLDTEPTISTTAVAGVVGTYGITLTGGSDNDYEFTLVSGELVINEVLSAGDFRELKLYPNPVTRGKLNVEGLEFGYLEVISLNGQTLIKTAESAVDVSDLNAGIYVVMIKDRKGRVLRKEKMVKTN